MSIYHGILKVNKQNRISLKYTNQKNKTNETGISSRVLTKSLYEQFNSSPQQLHNLEVDFEFDLDQPVRIRPTGETFQETIKPKTVKQDKFHNPYNFIPALPRHHLPKFDPQNPKRGLGDAPPIGHSCYYSDYWSGRIAVKLTTMTPLLIPDASEMAVNNDDHKTFPTRVDAQGNPYLPPTSIKGMLRSAYEAITNSRLSIFTKHGSQLAYRAPPKNTVIPARVEQEGEALYLCCLKAYKLPRYEKDGDPPDKGENNAALPYQGTHQLPQHGDQVCVLIDNNNKVTKIQPWNSDSLPGGDWQLGWVCITGANMNNKKYERVFIKNKQTAPPAVEVDSHVKELWKTLIANYQEIHKQDLEKRAQQGHSYSDYLGSSPGETAWSRHIYRESDLKLQHGTLCYVELASGCNPETNFQTKDIVALQPVTISRRLYQKKPDELLDQNLKPANNQQELSPADRVFGWVNQSGRGAYKGQLRVHSVQCLTENWEDNFGDDDNTVPLAILGQPNPQQARFYNAQDHQGTPLKDGLAKEEGYKSNHQGLRGRKVYPHHQGLPPNYWTNPSQDKTTQSENGHYQEYRHPDNNGEERNDQNRSMKNWVKEGVEFKFEIDVMNLSEVELGALLYLLNLPEFHFHRLGGGKPLGFGSVRLDVIEADTDLRTGEKWSEFYQCLLPNEDEVKGEPINLQTCIQNYQSAVKQAYGNGNEESIDEIHFIKAFHYAAKGFDDKAPVRYPRSTDQPNPEGEGFQWFVDNERTANDNPGKKFSLPPLYNPSPLPTNPISE